MNSRNSVILWNEFRIIIIQKETGNSYEKQDQDRNEKIEMTTIDNYPIHGIL